MSPIYLTGHMLKDYKNVSHKRPPCLGSLQEIYSPSLDHFKEAHHPSFCIPIWPELICRAEFTLGAIEDAINQTQMY